MLQLLIGSLSLSLVHALIPNHWIPLIAIGKAENWTTRQTISATIIAGFAHTLSTVIVGIIVGFAGYRLSRSYEETTVLVAPLVLIAIGIIYIIIDFIRLHHHHHLEEGRIGRPKKNRSRITLLASLSIAMFFSPCIELEAYFFQAGTQGWRGIILVSFIYTFITVLFMSLLVYLGMRGIEKLKWHFLERHEKRVTGLVLIALGLMSFFVRF
jgi:hypothetical protein